SINEAQLQAYRVALPVFARERTSIAGVALEAAVAPAQTEIAVQHGLAFRILDEVIVRRSRHERFAAQDAPADAFDDRREPEAVRIASAVGKANAIAQHLAGEIAPRQRDGVTAFAFEQQTIGEPISREQARLDAPVVD